MALSKAQLISTDALDNAVAEVLIGGDNITLVHDTNQNTVTVSAGFTVSAPDKLIGRYSAGSGNIEEISIGSGLNLSGGTLTATGGGGGGGGISASAAIAFAIALS